MKRRTFFKAILATSAAIATGTVIAATRPEHKDGDLWEHEGRIYKYNLRIDRWHWIA